jgi:leader peptidase (prepilin peptidase)/N-methyltransferase
VLVVVVVGVVVASVGVRAAARTPGARRWWWVAGIVGGGVAAVAWAQSPVPVAAALTAGGLVAAAAVDAAEDRIPTPLAYGTTAVSTLALALTAWDRSEWGDLLVRPLVATGLMAAVFGVLWLVGWMGFGDVRLATATITAMVPGSGGPVVVAWLALAATGVLVVVQRLRGHRPKHLPFGPGLALGWLAAIALYS